MPQWRYLPSQALHCWICHAYHQFPVRKPRPEVPWGVFTPMAPTPTSCARSSRHSDGTAGGGDAVWNCLAGALAKLYECGKITKSKPHLFKTHPFSFVVSDASVAAHIGNLQILCCCLYSQPARCNDDAIQDCCINVAWQSRMFDHQDDDESFHGSAFSYGLKRWEDPHQIPHGLLHHLGPEPQGHQGSLTLELLCGLVPSSAARSTRGWWRLGVVWLLAISEAEVIGKC